MGAHQPHRGSEGLHLNGYVSVALIDPSLQHLDRPFTYAVADGMSLARGSVVRVPFRGKRRIACVVDVMAEPDVDKTLPVHAVVGPGLPPDLVDLALWTAERYLATPGEALAAAIPARTASEETNEPGSVGDSRRHAGSPERGPIAEALRSGRHAGFLWRPATDAARGEEIAAMAAAADGGVLVLVPEVRARNDVQAALEERFGDALAHLGSDRSQRERYRDWLALRAGVKRIAVGGRAAVFAPVADLGLIVIDDEGHSSYKEGRAPRFHARTVAAERARRAGATLVLVGLPGSVEARAATTKGPYRLVAPPRGSERTTRPPVTVVERAGERLAPTGRTLTLAKRALAAGERVVVLVHRGEALTPIAERALRVLEPSSHAICSATTPATELRRAARSATVVVATPVVAKDLPFTGRALLVICEADAALAQPEFRAPEDAFSTWWRAARWASHVCLETDDPDQPAIRALVRWDPEVLVHAELARREELSYPPFAALARIDVPADRAEAVATELREAEAGIEVLGPVERAERWFVVARAPKRRTLLDALGPFVSRWRADDAPMRVDVDPWEVLATRWRS